MEIISKSLFWVANSLLIPDIIILLCLFARSLLLVGSFYNQFMVKRKNDQRLNELIRNLHPAEMETLKAALPARDNALFVCYLRDLLASPSEAYADHLISRLRSQSGR